MRLGLQPRDRPRSGIEAIGARRQAALPARAIVDARATFDPQFHYFGPQPVATPMRRAGDMQPGILLLFVGGYRQRKTERWMK